MHMIFFLLALLTAEAGSTIQMVHTSTAFGVPTWQFTTCSYKGLYQPDFRVSVVVKGTLCPLTIRYDPVTGTWSR